MDETWEVPNAMHKICIRHVLITYKEREQRERGARPRVMVVCIASAAITCWPLSLQIRVDSNNERSVHASRGPQGPSGDSTGPRQRSAKERVIKKEKQEGQDSQVVMNGVS